MTPKSDHILIKYDKHDNIHVDNFQGRNFFRKKTNTENLKKNQGQNVVKKSLPSWGVGVPAIFPPSLLVCGPINNFIWPVLSDLFLCFRLT